MAFIGETLLKGSYYGNGRVSGPKERIDNVQWTVCFLFPLHQFTCFGGNRQHLSDEELSSSKIIPV
jgi:hypothetical protein